METDLSPLPRAQGHWYSNHERRIPLKEGNMDRARLDKIAMACYPGVPYQGALLFLACREGKPAFEHARACEHEHDTMPLSAASNFLGSVRCGHSALPTYLR